MFFQVKFDKKLLDYDYGEEEEEVGSSSTTANAGTQPSDSITRLFHLIFTFYRKRDYRKYGNYEKERVMKSHSRDRHPVIIS